MPRLRRGGWWSFVARAFMAARECLVKDRRPEIAEETVADLYACLQHLTQRAAALDLKVQNATRTATQHKLLADKERTNSGRQRETARARAALLDRRRLQGELDRVTQYATIVRQNIDSLAATQLDGVVIDAMRGFNASAARLGLPDRSKEVESLVEQLKLRGDEVGEMQKSMHSVGEALSRLNRSALGDDDSDLAVDEDAELTMELECLLNDDADTVAYGVTPSALTVPAPQSHVLDTSAVVIPCPPLPDTPRQRLISPEAT